MKSSNKTNKKTPLYSLVEMSEQVAFFLYASVFIDTALLDNVLLFFFGVDVVEFFWVIG